MTDKQLPLRAVLYGKVYNTTVSWPDLDYYSQGCYPHAALMNTLIREAVKTKSRKRAAWCYSATVRGGIIYA